MQLRETVTVQRKQGFHSCVISKKLSSVSSERKDTTPKNKNRVLSKRSIQKTKRKNLPNLKTTEVIDSIKELENKVEKISQKVN